MLEGGLAVLPLSNGILYNVVFGWQIYSKALDMRDGEKAASMLE